MVVAQNGRAYTVQTHLFELFYQCLVKVGTPTVRTNPTSPRLYCDKALLYGDTLRVVFLPKETELVCFSLCRWGGRNARSTHRHIAELITVWKAMKAADIEIWPHIKCHTCVWKLSQQRSHWAGSVFFFLSGAFPVSPLPLLLWWNSECVCWPSFTLTSWAR